MQTIPLNNTTPNQQFPVTLDSTLFDITLRTINDRTYVDISINNNIVVRGQICVPGFQLMPSRYMEGLTGNFAFVTANDAYPIYTEFGVTQFLLYASAAELAAARGTYGII